MFNDETWKYSFLIIFCFFILLLVWLEYSHKKQFEKYGCSIYEDRLTDRIPVKCLKELLK